MKNTELSILKRAEWAKCTFSEYQGQESFFCPVCGAEKIEGHEKRCPLHAWIKRLEQGWTPEEFNKRFPPGTPVQVLRDNGDRMRTRTRSQAWILGGHTPVVMVEGIAGGYRLDRVEPEEEKP